MPQCSDCNFSRMRNHNGNQALECRYDPPAAQGQKGQWPEVRATDWCGKYQPGAAKEAPTEEEVNAMWEKHPMT